MCFSGLFVRWTWKLSSSLCRTATPSWWQLCMRPMLMWSSGKNSWQHIRRRQTGSENRWHSALFSLTLKYRKAQSKANITPVWQWCTYPLSVMLDNTPVKVVCLYHTHWAIGTASCQPSPFYKSHDSMLNFVETEYRISYVNYILNYFCSCFTPKQWTTILGSKHICESKIVPEL